jgi:hypothetical protein
MPASRGQSQTPQRKEIPNLKPKPTPPKSWQPLHKLAAVILGVATLIGVPAAIVTFWPSITVQAEGLFDEANSYSESFVASNNGYLTLENVGMSVGICSIETEKKDFWVTGTWRYKDRCGDPKLRIVNLPIWQRHILRHNEQMAITLSDIMTVATEGYRKAHPDIIYGMKTISNLVSADVVVVVTYSLRAWPWSREAPFRFTAEKQPNDKIKWRPRPMDDDGGGELNTDPHVQVHIWVPPENLPH